MKGIRAVVEQEVFEGVIVGGTLVERSANGKAAVKLSVAKVRKNCKLVTWS